MRIEADDPSKKQPKKEEFNPVKSEKHSFKSEIAKMKSMGLRMDGNISGAIIRFQSL